MRFKLDIIEYRFWGWVYRISYAKVQSYQIAEKLTDSGFFDRLEQYENEQKTTKNV